MTLTKGIIHGAETVWGKGTTLHPLSSDAEQSSVFLVRRTHQKVGVLKIHNHADSARREIAAYTHWWPALSQWAIQYRGHLPGNPQMLCFDYASGHRPTHSCDVDLWRNAGRMLKSLHQHQVDDHDPIDVTLAFQLRFEALRVPAESHLGRSKWAWATEYGIPGSHICRVACHRDFRPRNWLYTPDQKKLIVLDFGQSRLDDPFTDFSTLWPMLRTGDMRAQSFFHGYGKHLESQERRRLDALLCLRAIGTLHWGARHQNQRATDEGMRLLSLVNSPQFGDPFYD